MTHKNAEQLRLETPAAEVGRTGARTCQSVNGELFEKITARMEMRGTTFLMTTLVAAHIAGVRTALPVCQIPGSGCVLPLPCGTPAIPF
jgi:hypothetical protein